jgi:hypothetical protein
MRPPLALIGLLLLGGLTGCLGEKAPSPPIPSQGASSDSPGSAEAATDFPALETPQQADDEVLSEIEADIQDLEAFMAELESEEALDFSELLDLQ